MEPTSSDQKPTLDDLEWEKRKLEIEQLKKEARVPLIFRPGYLGPLLSALVGVGGLVLLYYTGFFDLERRTLELQKAELSAEVRDFEEDKERLITENQRLTEEKERLTREVAALQEKEETLARQLETTQKQYEAQMAVLQQRTQNLSGELTELQWNYLNNAIEEEKIGVMMARTLAIRLRPPAEGQVDSSSCFYRHLYDQDQYAECREQERVDEEIESVVRQISLDSYAEDCRINRVELTKDVLPMDLEAFDLAVERLRTCISGWTLPSAGATETADDSSRQ